MLIGGTSLKGQNGQERDPENGPFPESRTAELQGLGHHYRYFPTSDEAEKKGTVLLIHGFASSTFSWRKVYGPLTGEGYDVIAVDLPPFGFSERTVEKDLSAPAHAIRLWELMDREGVGELYVAGHSMGARVAGAMGTIAPERCRKVFLVDGPFYGTDRAGILRKGLFGLFNSTPFHFLFERTGRWVVSKRKRVARLLSSAYGEEADSQAVDGYIRPLRVNGTGASQIPFFSSPSSMELRLKDLTAPVHLIWGEKDTWQPKILADRFLRKFPYEARISYIEGAVHCPMETHPEAFLKVLLEEMGKE